MATSKKVTKKVSKPAAKTVAKPKTVAKKVTKKAPVVKTVRAKKAPKSETFKMTKESTPFTSFKVTEQTVYWVILFAYIFALSLWVLTIQINIMNVINTIAASLI